MLRRRSIDRGELEQHQYCLGVASAWNAEDVDDCEDGECDGGQRCFSKAVPAISLVSRANVTATAASSSARRAAMPIHNECDRRVIRIAKIRVLSARLGPQRRQARVTNAPSSAMTPPRHPRA